MSISIISLTHTQTHKNARAHTLSLSEMQILRWHARQMAQINGPRLTVPLPCPLPECLYMK